MHRLHVQVVTQLAHYCCDRDDYDRDANHSESVFNFMAVSKIPDAELALTARKQQRDK